MSMVSEVNGLTTATITEAAEVAHDQYDRLIGVIRRNPLTIGQRRGRNWFCRCPVGARIL